MLFRNIQSKTTYNATEQNTILTKKCVRGYNFLRDLNWWPERESASAAFHFHNHSALSQGLIRHSPTSPWEASTITGTPGKKMMSISIKTSPAACLCLTPSAAQAALSPCEQGGGDGTLCSQWAWWLSMHVLLRSTTDSHVVSKRHVLSRDIKKACSEQCVLILSQRKPGSFNIYTVDYPTLHALHHTYMPFISDMGGNPHSSWNHSNYSLTPIVMVLSPIYRKYTILDSHDVIL